MVYESRSPWTLVLKRISHKYGVVTLRTCRQKRDRRPDQFLDLTDIFDCLSRQIRPFSGTDGRFFPAFQCDVGRLDPRLRALACRKVIDFLSVKLVADADFQLVETIENIELGQRDAGNTIGGDRLAHQRGIEPATTTLATGNSAELMTFFAEELADFVMQFGRERAFADAGGVSLGDAENIT